MTNNPRLFGLAICVALIGFGAAYTAIKDVRDTAEDAQAQADDAYDRNLAVAARLDDLESRLDDAENTIADHESRIDDDRYNFGY